MNTDIRVQTTFKGHRKRLRLRAILGPGSTDYLIDLWITTAEDRPSGVFTGLDALDIAIMAGWQGDPAVFVQALHDVRFLDLNDGVYSLHDWHEHNPFVADSLDRGEKNRFTRLAATDRELYDKLKAEGCKGISAAQLAAARAEAKGAPPRLPKGKKTVHGENVTMTAVEHATLVEKYGEAFTIACIAKLSNYKSRPGSKKYKSDYGAINKWVVQEVAKSLGPTKPGGASGAKGERTKESVLEANAATLREFCGEGH